MKNHGRFSCLPFSEKTGVKVKLPTDIINIIMSYTDTYTLRPWILKHIKKLDWRLLSSNPKSTNLLQTYIQNINWSNLVCNSSTLDLMINNKNKPFWVQLTLSQDINALSFLEKNITKLDEYVSRFDLHRKPGWIYLSQNQHPLAIQIIEKHLDKVDWSGLSSNPSAVHILEKNMDKVNWNELSKNPQGIYLIEKHLDQKKIDVKDISWELMSGNPNGVSLIEKYLDKKIIDPNDLAWDILSSNPNGMHIWKKYMDWVDWRELSLNPYALSLLENHIECVDWNQISQSDHPSMIEFIEKHLDKVNEDIYENFWQNISENPLAISIINKNPEKVDLWYLSSNPEAVHILKENLNELNWERLSSNPSALEVLKENQDKIDWTELTKNSGIFIKDPKVYKILYDI